MEYITFYTKNSIVNISYSNPRRRKNNLQGTYRATKVPTKRRHIPTRIRQREIMSLTCVCLVGIVEFLPISTDITPPAVSIPRDSGVTSRSRRSLRTSDSSPARMAACTAAPQATASSGLIDLFNSLPLNRSCNRVCILGMRVDPPTRTISFIYTWGAFFVS